MQSLRWITLLTLIIVSSAFLTGCPSGTDTPPEVREYARSAQPEHTNLAETYNRSCRSCHSRGMGGAPLTGDGESWQTLLEQRGMDTLIRHTVEGFRGMPPMGGCPDCDRSDFRDLIDFMMQPHDY